jgi:heat shock protein HslJ
MRLWNGAACGTMLAGAVAILSSAAAFATEFPFEREMLLVAKPLRGSKRVPILEILRDGRAIVDLWCKSGDGRAEVADNTIKFTLGAMREDGCTPERLQRDEAMAAALEQVTHWRTERDVLVLIGPTELRYQLSSH